MVGTSGLVPRAGESPRVLRKERNQERDGGSHVRPPGLHVCVETSWGRERARERLRGNLRPAR